MTNPGPKALNQASKALIAMATAGLIILGTAITTINLIS